jgi:hypothetical protein
VKHLSIDYEFAAKLPKDGKGKLSEKKISTHTKGY